jgi:pimeloyl-ACP methyl ester carboxylesterase
MNLVALPSSRINVQQLPQRDGDPAEDVVMIHGLAANMGFWYLSAHSFTQFGRVTLYDMLGHGNSDMPSSGYSPRQLAEGLGHLLDRLKLDKVHLVAHSFGGMVALTFALSQPERVKSIILADVRVWQAEPPSWKTVSPDWLQQMRSAGLQLADSNMDPSIQVLVEFARLQVDKPEAAKIVAAALPGGRGLFRGPRAAQRWLDLIEKTGAYSEMTSGRDFELDDLRRIEQPILAVFGEHSLRLGSARALRRRCPNCRFELIPRAGHFFPMSRPRVFATSALRFLDSVARSKTDAGRRPAPPLHYPDLEPAESIDQPALIAEGIL